MKKIVLAFTLFAASLNNSTVCMQNPNQPKEIKKKIEKKSGIATKIAKDVKKIAPPCVTLLSFPVCWSIAIACYYYVATALSDTQEATEELSDEIFIMAKTFKPGLIMSTTLGGITHYFINKNKETAFAKKLIRSSIAPLVTLAIFTFFEKWHMYQTEAKNEIAALEQMLPPMIEGEDNSLGKYIGISIITGHIADYFFNKKNKKTVAIKNIRTHKKKEKKATHEAAKQQQKRQHKEEKRRLKRQHQKHPKKKPFKQKR